MLVPIPPQVDAQEAAALAASVDVVREATAALEAAR